ncbi:hypothetical protein EJ04DRAFT_565548 [Polyplosphaeria fusca]|uniref:Uncharacterized protein n=1 Tax=Polyplosphaeria fusca TaxID=682080 RepID=A0A9P4QSD5_9PLEO|nr:hypothetical protein EJ04DRAFT_565548 [Polyplosphaeria fusca]
MSDSMQTESPRYNNASLRSRLILILSIILPLVVVLAVVMAGVHCILKRHKRKLAKNHQADIEKSSERPTQLRVMTDFPTPELNIEEGFGAAPPVPPKDDKWLTRARSKSLGKILSPIQEQPHLLTPYPPLTHNRSFSATAHLNPTRTLSGPLAKPTRPAVRPLSRSLTGPTGAYPRNVLRTYAGPVPRMPPMRDPSFSGPAFESAAEVPPLLGRTISGRARIVEIASQSSRAGRHVSIDPARPTRVWDPEGRRTIYWG